QHCPFAGTLFILLSRCLWRRYRLIGRGGWLLPQVVHFGFAVLPLHHVPCFLTNSRLVRCQRDDIYEFTLYNVLLFHQTLLQKSLDKEIDGHGKANEHHEEAYPLLFNLTRIIRATIAAYDRPDHHEDRLRPENGTVCNEGNDCYSVDAGIE